MNTPYALSLARIVIEALGESLSTKSPKKQFHNFLINILVLLFCIYFKSLSQSPTETEKIKVLGKKIYGKWGKTLQSKEFQPQFLSSPNIFLEHFIGIANILTSSEHPNKISMLKANGIADTKYCICN